MCQFNADLIYSATMLTTNLKYGKLIWKGKQDSYIPLIPVVLKSDLTADNECGNSNEKGTQTGLWVIKGGHEIGWLGSMDMIQGGVR